MKNLKLLRISKGLSQQKLAEIFHLSQQSIWKYENDLAQPDFEVLVKLANYFDTSVDFLISNATDPHKYENLTEVHLTEQELGVLRMYRSVPEPIRQAIETLLEACYYVNT